MHSLHQLFEVQVARTPDAVSLIWGSESLTYRELNRRANQVADDLCRRGMAAGALVGLYMDRSPQAIIGIFGILKAGGAYLPLDPAYPQERLKFMLRDAQVSRLLTQTKRMGQFSAPEVEQICIDDITSTTASQSTENPDIPTPPDPLAYVIYTSGSTGTPKGVLGRHRGVVNRCRWMWQTYPFTDDDVCCQKTSLSFVDSVGEIFGPLLHGLPLVMISDPELKDLFQLVERLAIHRVTRIMLVPSLLCSLLELDLDLSGQLPLLTLWASSGEALSWALAQRFHTRVPEAILLNLYGSSEVAADATWYDSRAGYPFACVPIGRPIANMEVHILDDALKPVPMGESGELYVGGVGLARGYLNQPALTRERFIANPRRVNSEALLYKTGDLARYLPDGNIEFLGRLDQQVKIRGGRVELGEIESALERHPDVFEAVAAVREDASGEPQLAAFVVSDPERPPHRQALRGFLAEQLPSYMVPAAVVRLDDLPRTPNGKIDRLALPAPEDVDREVTTAFAPARTPVERRLVEIWTEVLGCHSVGIYDSFFELGGHSLLAVQIVSRIRRAFGIELPLHHLFDAPTVSDLCPHIEALMEGGGERQEHPLVPVSRQGELPLSLNQQGVWLMHQLEPDSAAYHIPLALRLDGVLDIEGLEASMSEMLRRHEALRTTFRMGADGPVQFINAASQVQVNVHDLQHISVAEQPRAVQRLLSREAQRPFDLTTDRLIRPVLLQLATDRHVLLFTIHHIIFDDWSWRIFLQELSSHYRARVRGLPFTWPEPALQYVDYAVWQQQALNREAMQGHLDYWKTHLTGAPDRLQLPTDYPHPARQTFRGGHKRLQLRPELVSRLKHLSRHSGATPFMILLTAFAILLHRYGGETDVVIGTPSANRSEYEVESILGFFVNTLVLRLDLGDHPTGLELLAHVRQVTLQAHEHQALPFEKLVEVLQPERHMSYHPLFQVMFDFQDASMPLPELPGLVMQQVDVESDASMFDLTLTMEETPHGLQGVFEYRTDLFEAATIDRLAGHFETLLGAMIASPHEGILNLPLLTSVERCQLLTEWQGAEIQIPPDLCLHHYFEAQVRRTPAAVAVAGANQYLSYEALNARADALACFLQQGGVGPHARVGICVGRSPDMIIGCLGVLKAGGAYVPLDPDYPPERLQFMLADAHVAALLTVSSVLTTMPTLSLQTFCLDTDWDTIAGVGRGQPQAVSRPDHLAYVIYTSGSTGVPKGVMVTHRSLVNAYLAWERAYGLPEAGACHLQMASFAFDVFTGDWIRALCSGAKLVLCPREMCLEPESLYALMCQEQVTCAEFVPAVLRLLMAYLQETGQSLDFMRLIMVGSDVWYAHEYREGLTLTGTGTRLIHSYGVTEATIDSTYFEGPIEAGEGARGVPIGRPFANMRMYVLDTMGQPVPIGVAGELCIGGEGLAQGYLNRPELTAKAFVPNPFQAEARLYKTGDWARYLPDGSLELLGRRDHQVKLRGFRVELGEVEAALGRAVSLRQSAVVIREDVPGMQRLIAYLVLDSDADVSPDALRHRLGDMLPDYMVPSECVYLPALPLTPNGKVDRAALPVPDTNRQRRDDTYVAPRDDIERQLQAIWQTNLGVQPIGVTDHFFDLGGYSLLAAKLFRDIRHVFGQNLPLATLFQAPTIQALAQWLRQDQPSASWSPLVALQTEGSQPPLFCVHPGGGNVLTYRDLAIHLGPDQPVYALQARGLDGQQTPFTSVEEMAAYYVNAVRDVQPGGPYYLGGLSAGGDIAWEMALQLQAQGEEVALLVLFDTYGPGYPQLLPPIPRCLSVLQWWVRDFAWRVIRFPKKLRVTVGQRGLRGTWREVCNRLGVAAPEPVQDPSLQKYEPLQSKIAHYTQNAVAQRGRWEVWLNVLIVHLLNRSSVPDVARRFANTLNESLGDLDTYPDVPEALQALERMINRASDAYVPPAYTGRIAYFVAERPPGIYADPLSGWGGLARGEVEIYKSPGVHAEIIYSPVLAEQLKGSLMQAQRRGTASSDTPQRYTA